jgi:hypothetical protein
MVLSEKQLDLIIGNLLGDGCITNCRRPNGVPRNGHFEINQKSTKIEYLEFIYRTLHPYSKSPTFKTSKAPIRKNGKVIHKHNEPTKTLRSGRVRTCASELLTKMHSKWYVDCGDKYKKIIPPDIELNWRRIAFWFCDDGGGRSNRQEITFSTNGFDVLSRTRLRNELKNFGITTSEWADGRICVVRNQYKTIIDKIKSLIPWKCFQHKFE